MVLQNNQPNLDNDSTELLESAIELKLAMSYEERIEAHENALRLLNDLKQAGEENRAKSPSSP